MHEQDELLFQSFTTAVLPPHLSRQLHNATMDTLNDLLMICLLSGLNLISSSSIPIEPPTSVGARHGYASDIVDAMQALDKDLKVTYSQLLYPNEHDSRRLLGWMVNRLPGK